MTNSKYLDASIFLGFSHMLNTSSIPNPHCSPWLLTYIKCLSLLQTQIKLHIHIPSCGFDETIIYFYLKQKLATTQATIETNNFLATYIHIPSVPLTQHVLSQSMESSSSSSSDSSPENSSQSSPPASPTSPPVAPEHNSPFLSPLTSLSQSQSLSSTSLSSSQPKIDNLSP